MPSSECDIANRWTLSQYPLTTSHLPDIIQKLLTTRILFTATFLGIGKNGVI